MGAYDELLATGVAGDETVALLRRLGAQYTRTHSFPPSEDYDRWSDEAVDDLIASMFEDKGPAFPTACLVSASDDASLERVLLTTIGNYLKDRAKKTERGKLRRRLEGLMTRDERFVRVSSSEAGIAGWTLAGRPTTVTTRAFSELEGAAHSVRGVSVIRWNTAGPTPAGTRHALLTIAETVLAVADGVVTDENLARVVESRFVLLAPLTFTELDASTPVPATDPDDDPAVLATVADYAVELWQGLSQTERSLVPHLGKTDAELAVIAGTGPRQARAIADALAEKLRLATVDDDQRDDVIVELLRLCQVRP